MTYCSACGSAASGKFCSACGVPLAAPNATPGPGEQGAAPPSRRRLRWLAGSAAAVLAAAAALAGTGGWLPGLERHADADAATETLTGTLLVIGSFAGDGCGASGMTATQRAERIVAVIGGQTFGCLEGPGGFYSDLAQGTEVRLTDADGTVLAAGKLSGGALNREGVSFTFEVDEVPAADLYQVQIGDQGPLTYTAADLEGEWWSVDITI